jgi:uncharacterized protein
MGRRRLWSSVAGREYSTWERRFGSRLPAVLAGCLLLGAQPVVAVIDCSKATSNADRLVCSNDRLAAAEEMMARAYRDALRRGVDRDKLQRSQRQWKTQVRDSCNDAACLERAYVERMSELNEY